MRSQLVATSLKCCDFGRRSDNQPSRLTYAFFRQLNNPAAVSDLLFYFPARRVVHFANLAVHAFGVSLFLGGPLRHTDRVLQGLSGAGSDTLPASVI
jgi:hypothetical protein